MENWKTIEYFEQYEVSDLGRVRRKQATRHHPGKVFLKPWVGTGGYLQLHLYKDSKNHDKSIHILVAEAFVPNPLNLPEVNHLGPKSDCRASQLEWATKRSNTIHAVKTGRTPGDGISFIKQTGRWRVRWNPEPCVREHVGVFDTFEEAETARAAKIATL
jgi:NUMOD4 motif-containing protein